jgi:tetratricopeptide (TPR) repeat protein
LEKPIVQVADRLTESAQSQSVSDRFDYWREGSAMFAERPVFGWGVGTYKEVHPAFQRGAVTATNNPHSLPVQVLVELGVVGFVALLVMIAGFIGYLWRERFVKRSPTIWAARVALIVVALHSFVDLATNYPTLILILLVLAALAVPIPQEHGEFRLKDRRAMTGFGLASLAMLFATWFTYQLYLSRIDQAYIDVLIPFEMEEAGQRYEALLETPVVPPDTLSQAALFWVDMYDAGETPQPKYAERAARLATEATRREPRDARHWYALGNASERLGKTSEALAAYRRAVELDPYNNPQYQVSYAQLLAQEGFTQEALEVLGVITGEYTDEVIANRSFIRIGDRVAIALTQQAQLQLESGDTAAAAQSLARARLLSPNYQPAEELEKQLSQ